MDCALILRNFKMMVTTEHSSKQRYSPGPGADHRPADGVHVGLVEELLGRLSEADELTELRAGIQGKWRQACNSDPGSSALGVCSLLHPLSTASGRQGRAGFREVPTLCPFRAHGHRCPPSRAGSGLRCRPRASSCCFVTCPHISPPERTDAQRVVRCG